MELKQREATCPACRVTFTHPLTGGEHLQRCPSCRAILLVTRYNDGYHVCQLDGQAQPTLPGLAEPARPREG